MTTLINSRKEIPNTPFYVLCNDTFMSNWGMSDRKINTIIIPCYNYVQAYQISKHIEAWRTDQNRIRVTANKPKLNFNTHTYSLFNHDNAPSWYLHTKVQQITFEYGVGVTIMRETGKRFYPETLDRVIRLINVLDFDRWVEIQNFYHVIFEPKLTY